MDWLERCVTDADRFLHTQWRRGPALLRPADPPTEVLGLADLDKLLDSGTLRVPYAGLFTMAGAVPEAAYCPPRVVAGRYLEGWLDAWQAQLEPVVAEDVNGPGLDEFRAAVGNLRGSLATLRARAIADRSNHL